ncbi:TonB-dependent receptor plug domain-containing protein [Flavobacterium bizetiae]|uniref:TonB-dependent receptor plug domain-containing protein n=1 Tax=Flavobacterium bizetiae TaxID=2704140 RepID=UPI001E38E9E5|nr:TonB-dependent receptor plug domain-containing protein [Flavobacterium bizetiae]
MPFSSLFAKSSYRHNFNFFQQIEIKGTVKDGSNPLPGVTISVKNKLNVAAISDYSGQYTIAAAPADTLVVSFIGFKTAFIAVKNRKVVDVQLHYDTTILQEVRVNAGYYSVKESERTGNIARITSKDIETQPVTNVLAAMQGRMAGVSIIQQTGVPGGGFDIKIRGQNSLRTDANQPLYIIDGVPYSSDPVGYNQTSSIYPAVTSPLNSINPDAIESIEVLKDADATSIYGSRGANGVVLITTKKGKKGKTVFTVKTSTGAGSVAKFMDLMNTEQYLEMRRQAFLNDKIPYRATDYDVNGTWDQNRYTDWQKELIGGTSVINNVQGTISGGSDKTQFLLSRNYRQESSVFPGSFPYKKGGGQFNLNHTSQDDKFRLTFSAGFTAQKNNQPAFDLTYDARSLAPNAPALYNPDGSLNWENSTWENPLRNLNAEYKSQTNDLVTNALLSYEIIPSLFIKTSLGYTNLNTIETRTSPSSIYNPIYNATSANSKQEPYCGTAFYAPGICRY